MKTYIYLIILTLTTSMTHSLAQETNYDEQKVPSYQLPDLLVSEKGEEIQSADSWRDNRRGEILALFEQEVYGKIPLGNLEVNYQVGQLNQQALAGKTVQKEVIISFSNGSDTLAMNVLIFLPAQAEGPVPLFLGMNFNGNHAVHHDSSITITPNYVSNNEKLGITDNQATSASRGTSAHRWPVAQILERGYGIATVYYGDIDPDFDDHFQNGIHKLMDQEQRSADAWGSLATWGWGLSRVMDYFEQDQTIDAQRVALLGHSRLGKAALWAGALDQRFALVISNDSGCGGAALSRRKFGETVARINGSFPHWFCENFREYNDREDQLPIDQHMLLALMAPRPVYVASAAEDPWADPKGEYLSLYHAGPVYKLFGTDALGSDTPPEVDTPVRAGKFGYHIRSGKHDLTKYDWEQYLDFADQHLQK